MNEFDGFIKNYRKNCDNALYLSGESSEFFAEYKALKLKEWFPENITKECSILDFGCGDGLMAFFVQNNFEQANLYGVDPSPESIKTAQNNFPGIEFATNYENSYDLNFPDNRFDLIYAAGTFHHIPFDMHKGYIQEIFRVLKPGGSFVLFELNPLNPLTFITFKRNPIDYNATMMTPWYSYKLCKNNANKRSIKFYCFYPSFLKQLRSTEKYITKIPFGALYAVIGAK
jgi:ubiquinone/menaquinone biosynthesis C-methylase UbiE